MTSSSRTRWAISLALVYFSIFAAQFFWAYIPRYLTGLGWSATAAGGVLSIITIVKSVVMPAWGRVADNVDNSAALLKFLMVAGAGAALFFPFTQTATGLWIVFVVFALTIMTVTPLIDILAVREVAQDAFGRIRSFGSFGYAVAALGVAAFGMWGVGATHSSLAGLAPWAMAAGFTLAALAALTLPQSSARPRGLPTLEDARRLVANRHVRYWLPVWFLHWMTIAAYNLFFVMLCEERDLAAWVPGVAIGGGVLAEVVVLAVGGRWVKRLGPERLLALTILVTIVRWFLTGATTSGMLMIALQLVHGVSFGAFLLSAMSVLDRETPDSIRATVQAMLYVVVFGLGSAASHAASGVVVDLAGAPALFYGAGAVECLAFMVALFAILRLRPRAGESSCKT